MPRPRLHGRGSSNDRAARTRGLLCQGRAGAPASPQSQRTRAVEEAKALLTEIEKSGAPSRDVTCAASGGWALHAAGDRSGDQPDGPWAAISLSMMLTRLVELGWRAVRLRSECWVEGCVRARVLHHKPRAPGRA